MPPRVFISYRRSDSAGHAGRLLDGVAAALGPECVFMDTADVAPGEVFPDRLRNEIVRADHVLAVIGPDWVDAVDATGHRRLEQPDDHLRLELLTALRQQIPIVPVLVRGATSLTADVLPAALQHLARIQVAELRDTTWPRDLAALIERITTVHESMTLHSVTAIACDVAGYSALAERLDASDLMNLVRQVTDIEVEALGRIGAVPRQVGDMVVAHLVGAPEEGRSHACDAVATALDIATRVGSLLASPTDHAAARVGVHRGDVVLPVPVSADDLHAHEVTVATVRLSLLDRGSGAPVFVSQALHEVLGARLVDEPAGSVHLHRSGTTIAAWRVLELLTG